MAVELFKYPPFFNHANLVHYWRLEGNSNDAKGSNNGTDTNITYSSGDGKFGQGAAFNGTSSKITFANPSIGANFTIMTWIKPTDDWGMSDDALWDTYPSTLGSCIVRGQGDGTLRYFIGGEAAVFTSAIPNIAGQWHHVAMVGSGNNTLRIILDGVSIGSHTFTGPFASNSFILGNFNGGNWFKGAMDEAAIFSTNIATADILAYYNFVQGGGQFLHNFI